MWWRNTLRRYVFYIMCVCAYVTAFFAVAVMFDTPNGVWTLFFYYISHYRLRMYLSNSSTLANVREALFSASAMRA